MLREALKISSPLALTSREVPRFHGRSLWLSTPVMNAKKKLTFISSSNSGSVGSTISEKLKFGKGESKTPLKGVPFSSVKNEGNAHIRFGSNQVSSSYPAEYQKQISKKEQNNNGFTYMIHLAFDMVQQSYVRIALPGKFITALCCDKGQNDTIGKIELNPSSVLSSKSANSRNDIQ